MCDLAREVSRILEHLSCHGRRSLGTEPGDQIPANIPVSRAICVDVEQVHGLVDLEHAQVASLPDPVFCHLVRRLAPKHQRGDVPLQCRGAEHGIHVRAVVHLRLGQDGDRIVGGELHRCAVAPEHRVRSDDVAPLDLLQPVSCGRVEDDLPANDDWVRLPYPVILVRRLVVRRRLRRVVRHERPEVPLVALLCRSPSHGATRTIRDGGDDCVLRRSIVDRRNTVALSADVDDVVDGNPGGSRCVLQRVRRVVPVYVHTAVHPRGPGSRLPRRREELGDLRVVVIVEDDREPERAGARGLRQRRHARAGEAH